MVAGRQCREWPRSQKEWGRDRALLGCGSLPEREWDHANGYKQNQVTGALKKMAFNGGVKLFFHFTFSFFKSEFFSIAGLVSVSPFYLEARQHGKTFFERH